jgi:hypothetical protein
MPTGCDPAGPHLAAGRAWFDAYDNRFGMAMLQVEGTGAVGPSCTYTMSIWAAISTSNNPNSTWQVFAFPINFGSDPTGLADFTGFGFDADGVFFSANIWNNSRSAFEYADIVGCGKQGIYGGGSIVCNGLDSFTASNGTTNIQLDTLQPVESLSTDFSPHAEYFVSTFNLDGDLSGNNCISTACSGVVVWSWSDPANISGSGNVFSAFTIPTVHSYVEPPWATESTCKGPGGCLDTGSVEISSMPIYRSGHIYFAHETGVLNASTQLVVGIQWFDLVPSLATGWPTKLAGVTEYQEGLLNGKNNFLSCVDPVIMPDLDNDLILGYDYMGDTVNPSVNFTFRRVTDPLGTITGGLGITAVQGTTVYPQGAWGDWSSMSYPAPYQDFIWMVGIYSTGTPDWSTELMKFRFNLNG